MEIDVSKVKELREKTGAGVMAVSRWNDIAIA